MFSGRLRRACTAFWSACSRELLRRKIANEQLKAARFSLARDSYISTLVFVVDQ